MSNLFEKLLYNAVGTMSVSSNKFKELLEDLIQNGAYTEDEGKRIVQQMNADFEKLSADMKSRVISTFEQVVKDLRGPIDAQVEQALAGIKEKIKSLPYGSTFIK